MFTVMNRINLFIHQKFLLARLFLPSREKSFSLLLLFRKCHDSRKRFILINKIITIQFCYKCHTEPNNTTIKSLTPLGLNTSIQVMYSFVNGILHSFKFLFFKAILQLNFIVCLKYQSATHYIKTMPLWPLVSHAGWCLSGQADSSPTLEAIQHLAKAYVIF